MTDLELAEAAVAVLDALRRSLTECADVGAIDGWIQVNAANVINLAIDNELERLSGSTDAAGRRAR